MGKGGREGDRKKEGSEEEEEKWGGEWEGMGSGKRSGGGRGRRGRGWSKEERQGEEGKERKKNARMSLKIYDQQRWNDIKFPSVKVFQVLRDRLITTPMAAK